MKPKTVDAPVKTLLEKLNGQVKVYSAFVIGLLLLGAAVLFWPGGDGYSLLSVPVLNIIILSSPIIVPVFLALLIKAVIQRKRLRTGAYHVADDGLATVSRYATVGVVAALTYLTYHFLRFVTIPEVREVNGAGDFVVFIYLPIGLGLFVVALVRVIKGLAGKDPRWKTKPWIIFGVASLFVSLVYIICAVTVFIF